MRYLFNQKGWLFVDILIATALITIALVSIVQAYGYLPKVSNYNQRYTEALMLAKTELETLRLQDNTASTTFSLPANKTVSSTSNANFTYTISFTTINPTPTLLPGRVTVSWTDLNNNTKIVRLDGYCYVKTN